MKQSQCLINNLKVVVVGRNGSCAANYSVIEINLDVVLSDDMHAQEAVAMCSR